MADSNAQTVETPLVVIPPVTREQVHQNNDTFNLQNSDNPSMKLITVPLNGKNYLSWSRSMTLALRAKEKLGFIDGSCKIPPAGYTNLEK